MICCRILDKRKTPLPLLYDFVFDRLRAVRQDLVVQGYLEGYTGLKTVLVVKILEYCVRFYVYFQFRYLCLTCVLYCVNDTFIELLFFCRLAHLPPSVFSSHINQNHLDECLSQLLHLYSEIELKNQDLLYQTNYIEIEALHLLLSKDSTSLHRAIQLPCKTKSHAIVNKSIEINISLRLGNFVRANRIAQDLPLSLQLAYRANFSHLRLRVLEVYERSHRSPQGSKFPLDKLSRYLLFDTTHETADFCIDHGLFLDDTCSSVIFKTGTPLKPNASSKSNNVCNRLIEEQLNDVRISNLLYGQSI